MPHFWESLAEVPFLTERMPKPPPRSGIFKRIIQCERNFLRDIVNRVRYCSQARAVENECFVAITGYIGNLKTIPLKEMLAKHPERVIEKAVKGMLPKNSLGKQMYRKLKVYAGNKHPHAAQEPKALEV